MMRCLLILILLSVAGCSRETADSSELKNRSGIIYRGDSKEPFTGIAYDRWSNGKTRLRQPFVDGKEHGWTTTWYEDGKKSSEGECSNGERIGVWNHWDRNGYESVYDYGC